MVRWPRYGLLEGQKGGKIRSSPVNFNGEENLKLGDSNAPI